MRYAFVPALFLTSSLGCFSAPSPAQAPRYVALSLPQAPVHSGCVLARTRIELRAALQTYGYTGEKLPAIQWERAGAALILSNTGTIVPDSYIYQSAAMPAIVLTDAAPAGESSYAYVLEVSAAAAAAAGCSLLDANQYHAARAANPAPPPQPQQRVVKPARVTTTGKAPDLP